MKITVLIVIGLMVVMLLILAFSKKDYTIVDPPFDSDELWANYILRENLVEQEDRSYKVPTREMQQIGFTSYAVRCASKKARDAIRIDQTFFDKLKNTYAQAYVLYMNGSAASAKDRGFQYIRACIIGAWWPACGSMQPRRRARKRWKRSGAATAVKRI